MSCMEWLWIDPAENQAEWLSPDEWRLRDIDQQIRFYHGDQRRQAEEARNVASRPTPASEPKQGWLIGARR